MKSRVWFILFIVSAIINVICIIVAGLSWGLLMVGNAQLKPWDKIELHNNVSQYYELPFEATNEKIYIYSSKGNLEYKFSTSIGLEKIVELINNSGDNAELIQKPIIKDTNSKVDSVDFPDILITISRFEHKEYLTIKKMGFSEYYIKNVNIPNSSLYFPMINKILEYSTNQILENKSYNLKLKIDTTFEEFRDLYIKGNFYDNNFKIEVDDTKKVVLIKIKTSGEVVEEYQFQDIENETANYLYIS